ncbi:hypothetical protein O3P69_016799 [Scylla paramamosain]|uniref:Uncharacterized protein n=1 Tax=Scylla paramamosain TaxID=85552 RepID=A0AAW0SZU6_SCYPA
MEAPSVVFTESFTKTTVRAALMDLRPETHPNSLQHHPQTTPALHRPHQTIHRPQTIHVPSQPHIDLNTPSTDPRPVPDHTCTSPAPSNTTHRPSQPHIDPNRPSTDSKSAPDHPYPLQTIYVLSWPHRPQKTIQTSDLPYVPPQPHTDPNKPSTALKPSMYHPSLTQTPTDHPQTLDPPQIIHVHRIRKKQKKKIKITGVP